MWRSIDGFGVAQKIVCLDLSGLQFIYSLYDVYHLTCITYSDIIIMYYQEKKLGQLFGQNLEKNLGESNLFNELVYGKKMKHLNVMSQVIEDITLYLHESNPQILICLTEDSESKPFDIRRIKTQRSNYRLSSALLLKQKIYLALVEDYEEIILIFKKEGERQKFKRGLKQISKYLSNYPSRIDSTIIKNFIKADKNKNYELSQNQIINLFEELKIEDEAEIQDMHNFIATNSKKSGHINYREFERLANIVSCRKQFKELFEREVSAKLTDHNSFFEKIMTKAQMKKFLEMQSQSESSIQRIISNCFSNNNSKISFFQFCHLLMSSANNAIEDSYFDFQQSLDHPLTQYYCYSSHNTYLTGNQLTSDSKAQRYYEDLQDGIRCVEIDCHDGAYGPIVKHGYTVTSSVTFQEVIEIIQRFRQQNPSHTPIILSLENHCSTENQYEMAKIIEKNFGNSLVIISQFESSNKVLTLRQGIGRVIIKGTGNLEIYNEGLYKQNKKKSFPITFDNNQEDDDLQAETEIPIILGEVTGLNIVNDQINQQKFNEKKENFYEKIETLKERKNKFQKVKPNIQEFIKTHLSVHKHRKSKKVVNLKLLSLTAMLGNGTVGSPSPWESNSISEKNILKAFEDGTEYKIKKHVKSGWIRVYPQGTRFDSSNYDPLPAMELGAQIIALNTQMDDHPNFLMQTFFDKGKKFIQGYRIKPDLQDLSKKSCTVKIFPISASKIYYNDPARRKQIPNCQIWMKFYGVRKDLQKNVEEITWNSYTESKKDNAFNPIYEYGHTMLIRFHSKQLSFVAIEIKECGVGILPLGYIKKGYRTVTLYDDELRPKDSKIVLNIE